MKRNSKDKNKSGIYLIRNLINGKVYIGKSRDIDQRIGQHITMLNKKCKTHENDHFINAWSKYGKLNFAYVVLEYLPLNEELLSKKELEYIDLYNSLDSKKGYNKRYDSLTGLIVSQETRERLSQSQKKRYLNNPEERLKISINSSNFWKNNPEKKKIMSTKVALKIRKYKIGKFTYDSKQCIEIFNTREELRLKNPDYYIQAILGCCDGRKKSYNGFLWRYISIETGEIIYSKKIPKSRSKKKITL